MICGWNQLTVWDHSPDCFSLFALAFGFGTQQLWDVVTGPKLMKLFYQPIFCGPQYLLFVNFQDLQNNHNHSVGSATARARYNSWQRTRTRRILRVSAVGHRGRVVNSSFFDRSYAKYGDWWLPTVHRFCPQTEVQWCLLVPGSQGGLGWPSEPWHIEKEKSDDVGKSYHSWSLMI